MDWIGLDLTFPITDPTWIFLLVLLIILFAPILLNKLRIPHIIGMILAGLAIGEHGFNILARDSSFQLFLSLIHICLTSVHLGSVITIFFPFMV